MLPIIVIFTYLAVVLYIGIFAFRKGKSTGEDFFLANRSIGSVVFFLSLFATNMTAVAILGSSGFAYKRGIGVFGMMASASAFVIPISLFVIGTRLWSLGKRFGHMTQVSYFRDRWECSFIGTVIFGMTAAMLLPYLIVSIVGGGTILEALTGGRINYHIAGAIVALVVMGNVFFGGMRGAVLVNVFQTILFLCFGLVAFAAIGHSMPGGFTGTVKNMIAPTSRMTWALARTFPNAISPITTTEFFSYCFIPLSSIMFPHMSIMCLTAKKVTAFKKTVVLYPLCIMAIWLPCVFLGGIANGQPKVNAAIASESPEVKAFLASHGAGGVEGKPMLLGALLKEADSLPSQELMHNVRSLNVTSDEFAEGLFKVVSALPHPKVGAAPTSPGPADAPKAPLPLYNRFVAEVGRLSKTASTDSVLLQMLRLYVPAWLSGLLAAGIISAVMGSDCHQILALSTMFTSDVYNYYGGQKAYGEKSSVYVGRAFILLANTVAFIIAWGKPNIFELAISWAFSGFAALAPVMLAALFWKRSTKFGALAATIFVTAAILTTGWIEKTQKLPEGSKPVEKVISSMSLFGHHALTLSPGGGKLFIFGFMPVVFMVLGSAVCVVVFSLLSKPPTDATIRKYFGSASDSGVPLTAGKPRIAAI